MSEILIEITIAFLTGFILTSGVIALVKIRPERKKIAFAAAETAIVVQSQIISELRKETGRLREEIGDQDAREVQIDDHWSIAFQRSEPASEFVYESVLIRDPDWRKN